VPAPLLRYRYRPTGPRGVFLPQFYGIDLSSPFFNNVNTINAFVKTFPSKIINNPFPSLIHMPRNHAVLSSHLLLNRSHLNAVKAFHDHTGTALRHCQQCSGHSVSFYDETVLHTVSKCIKFHYQRSLLKNKLDDIINKFQQIHHSFINNINNYNYNYNNNNNNLFYFLYQLLM
jgi:hypothetical protein